MLPDGSIEIVKIQHNAASGGSETENLLPETQAIPLHAVPVASLPAIPSVAAPIQLASSPANLASGTVVTTGSPVNLPPAIPSGLTTGIALPGQQIQPLNLSNGMTPSVPPVAPISGSLAGYSAADNQYANPLTPLKEGSYFEIQADKAFPGTSTYKV